MKTHKDIDKLYPYITGVNIKLEKSGGYRGAVYTLMLAEEKGLHKWVGIMIGSSLNSSQAA